MRAGGCDGIRGCAWDNSVASDVNKFSTSRDSGSVDRGNDFPCTIGDIGFESGHKSSLVVQVSCIRVVILNSELSVHN